MLVLLTATAWLPVSATASVAPGMTISGGDLPHPVRLAAADEDAFRRRINTPPRLDSLPDRAADLPPDFLLGESCCDPADS
jgi:hypothetical protein